MSNQKNEAAATVAEKIRRSLFRIDLLYTEAEVKMLVAEEDYKKYSKLGGVTNKRKAQEALAKARVWETYISNLKAIKNATVDKLDEILDDYTPKYKQIFIMFFLERRAIEDIVQAVNYSRRHVDRIIAKLKDDLEESYPLAK